jgi:hypothetical protein
MLPTTASTRLLGTGYWITTNAAYRPLKLVGLRALMAPTEGFTGRSSTQTSGGGAGGSDGLEAVADCNSPCESFLPGIASITTRCRCRTSTDRSMGATQFQGLYNRSRWKKMSRQQRMRAPLCEMCKARGLVVVAQVVDHIRPHHGDERLFFDPQNLQSLWQAVP